jgi:hypothetical protein
MSEQPVIEVGGDVSYDAAREFTLKYRHMVWVHARVTAGGTTLTAQNGTRYHFRALTGGREGGGPSDTVRVLYQAGFGPVESIRKKVYARQPCEFSNQIGS